MNKNLFNQNKNRKVRSLLLLVCLFLWAVIIPPVVAKVSSPTPEDLAFSPQTWGAGGANNEYSPHLRTEGAITNVKQAQTLYKEQNYEAAIPLWQQAIEAYEKSGDSQNQAMALSNLSLTYQQLGQWEAAENAIASSLKLLQSESDNSLLLAQTLDVRGKLQRETGKPSQAIETWQQAANIYQKLENKTVLEQNYLNQAQALQDLGLYPRACKRLLNTLSLEGISDCQQLNELSEIELEAKIKPLTSKPSVTTVSALRSLGDLLVVIGQPLQSEQLLNISLKSAQKINAPIEIATTYLSQGNTYQALAEVEDIRTKSRQYEIDALNAYSEAAAIAPSADIKLKAQLNKLSYSIDKEKWTEAEPLWRSLYPEITNANLPNSRDSLYAKINYGRNLVKLIALDDATISAPSLADTRQLLLDAADRAKALGDNRIEAYAWGSLGRLEETVKEYPTAKQYTKQALNLISSYDAADIAYQYYWQLGRIEKENDIPKAIASYTKAYNALQSLRGDIATINPEVQFSFRDEVEPVYRELVELDLKYAQVLNTEGNEADRQVRLTQARDVIESLQIAQLNNFFREACIDANPQVIDAIDPDAAVVYPIILKNELEILVSLPNKPLSLYKSDVSQTELENTVKAIDASLESPIVAIETLQSESQPIYSWLIEPIEAELANNKVKTIAFVLDGVLRNIPMSALYDGEQYLVEKYALALTPGLQLLNPKSLAEVKLDAVTGGLSKVNQDVPSHRNFGELKAVPEELKIIRSTGLADSSLLDSEFTKAAIKQKIAASDTSIIHLSTHAKFSSKAENTFILSWDGEINIRDLDDLLRDDTFTRQNEIELLVLSACETASGDPRATLGLAGVAVQAGARSTLATLWAVADESTTQLIGEFYRQLQKSQITKANKAQVLRQAQLSLIKDKKFNHPYFWSPFVLIGNWQ